MFVATQEAPGRAREARPPAHGLVETVTSRTREVRHGTNAVLRSDCYRGLNSERRVRRMRRVVVASADASRESLERGGRRTHAAFITLTYRPGVLWSRRDMSEFTDRLRHWCNRRGVAVRYQWVIELTKRGVPHYHVLLWLPKGLMVPKPDKAGWWTRGLSRTERARRPVGYLVKYTSKGTFSDGSSEIPKGARLFGCANAREERHAVSRARLPVWLADCTEPHQVPKRVARVGFVCPESGKVYRSPYSLNLVREADGRYTIVFLITEGTL